VVAYELPEYVARSVSKLEALERARAILPYSPPGRHRHTRDDATPYDGVLDSRRRGD